MLASSSVTPEPAALLPGEEEQLQQGRAEQTEVMSGAPGGVTPAHKRTMPRTAGTVHILSHCILTFVLLLGDIRKAFQANFPRVFLRSLLGQKFSPGSSCS